MKREQFYTNLLKFFSRKSFDGIEDEEWNKRSLVNNVLKIKDSCY